MAGGAGVDPALTEIRVTFSKDMMDQSWSWSSAWKDSDAPSSGSLTTTRSAHLHSKSETGAEQTYGYWINSQNFTVLKMPKAMPPCRICWCFRPSPTSSAVLGNGPASIALRFSRWRLVCRREHILTSYWNGNHVTGQ